MELKNVAILKFSMHEFVGRILQALFQIINIKWFMKYTICAKFQQLTGFSVVMRYSQYNNNNLVFTRNGGAAKSFQKTHTVQLQPKTKQSA